jgi:hypothetical protein
MERDFTSPVRLSDFIAAIERQLGLAAEHNLMLVQPGDVARTGADASLLVGLTGYRPTTSSIGLSLVTVVIGEGQWRLADHAQDVGHHHAARPTSGAPAIA